MRSCDNGSRRNLSSRVPTPIRCSIPASGSGPCASSKPPRTSHNQTLSTLPEDIGFERLVELAKLRWRIERDYQELKQELGLGHYEGRGWRGFHHHASLCIAAYGFLVAEREAIPPSGQRRAIFREEPAVPHGYRPRGSPDPA